LNESQEAALIRRCQTGDKEAFGMLVEQYRSMLFGIAYLMMRDRGLAEDVVQEALIQIWKHLPSFRLQSSIKTWLVRIVINEVKQQFRKKKLPQVSLEDVPDVTNELDEPESVLIHDQERQRLRQAIAKLPSDQREAIVLRYFSDLSVPEIAAATNQPEGTIKSRLSRALEHLNEILNRNVGGEEISWTNRNLNKS
jgi:RNA polymerase sigma-70 factor (ECF subfamily)